mmetsp:Transcript_6270/g.9627  ORF Transcript_6270/g.9627 Transcript_6270/m.9627 type:complete len:507 (+) Transcript_6270:1533-3053(+)
MDTKPRMCHDFRYINAFIPARKFRLESLQRDLPHMLQENDVLTKADMAKAFYTLVWHRTARHMLGFRSEQQGYALISLGFGYALGPWLFHSVMRVPISFFRQLRIRCLNYIDDWLFACRPEGHRDTKRITMAGLLSLGFAFNEKCDWAPKKQQTFLGLEISTQHMTFGIPSDKREQIMELIATFLKADRPLLSQLRTLTGKLSAVRLAASRLRLWMTQIYKFQTEKSKYCSKRGAKSFVLYKLPQAVVGEFRACLRILEKDPRAKFILPKPTLTFHLDTGEYATGYHGPIIGEGTIPLPVASLFTSSTHRELRGLERVLAKHSGQLTGNVILPIMDSQASAQIMTKGASSRQDIADILREMYQVADANEIQILPAKWIPREENTKADELSHYKCAWSLRKEVLKRIRAKLGRIPIWEINFNTVGQDLAKILRQRSPAILIHPRWPSRSWWPRLQAHTHMHISLRPPRYSLMSNNNRFVKHLRWSLQASLVKHTKARRSRSKVRRRV